MMAPAQLPITSPDTRESMRVQLVQAVIDAVKSRAYPGSAFTAATVAAGISPQAIQHHFGSPSVMMARVLEQLIDASGALPDPGWPSPSAPLADRAHQTVWLLWRQVYEPERFLMAWQMYLDCREDRSLLDAVASRRKTQHAALIQRLLTVFPEMPHTPDTHGLLELLLSSLRGIGLLRLFEPEDATIGRQLDWLALLLVRHCQASAESGPSATG